MSPKMSLNCEGTKPAAKAWATNVAPTSNPRWWKVPSGPLTTVGGAEPVGSLAWNETTAPGTPGRSASDWKSTSPSSRSTTLPDTSYAGKAVRFSVVVPGLAARSRVGAEENWSRLTVTT